MTDPTITVDVYSFVVARLDAKAIEVFPKQADPLSISWIRADVFPH